MKNETTENEVTENETASQLAELKTRLLEHPEDFRNRDLMLLLPGRFAVLRREGPPLLDKIDAVDYMLEYGEFGVRGARYRVACKGTRKILEEERYGILARDVIGHIRGVVDGMCSFASLMHDDPLDDWVIGTGVVLLAGFRHTEDTEPAHAYIRAHVEDREEAELTVDSIRHIWEVTLKMCEFHSAKLVNSANLHIRALDALIAGVLFALVVHNAVDGSCDELEEDDE